MAFGINTHDLPTFHTYSGALFRWERTAPWRGKTGEYDERPLTTNRRAKHKVIRKLNDGSIACRLYDIDLVIYKPDNTIEIRPYGSKSSWTFIKAIAPCSWRIITTNDLTKIWYSASGGFDSFVRVRTDADLIRFSRNDGDNSWEIDQTQLRWSSIERVNRKGTNEVLSRTRFKDFEAWVKMRHAIEPIKHKERPFALRSIQPHGLDEYYRVIQSVLSSGPEVWEDAVENNFLTPYSWSDVDERLKVIRGNIMRTHETECYTQEVTQFVKLSQLKIAR